MVEKMLREAEACGPAYSGNNWKIGPNWKPNDPILNTTKIVFILSQVINLKK